MRPKLKRLAGALLAVVILSFAGMGYCAGRQQRAIVALEHQIARAGGESPGPSSSIDDVPAPVARYLKWALPDGIDVESVRLTQEGTLRTDGRTDSWMAFTATHVVSARTAAFVWNARVQVAPLIHLRVRDALVDGVGSGQVTLMSAIRVGGDAGTPEMHSGSLHRYLAEAAWYPSVLRGSDRLAWKAIDDTRALATLRDRATAVSLEFRFGSSGAIEAIYTPGRWGKFDDGYRQVAWEGHFRDYTRVQGVAVPTNADVGWYTDGEWQPVWKGRMVSFEPALKK